MTPAYNLGDAVPRRIRWTKSEFWGHTCRYEVQCSSCPDCSRNFISGRRSTTAIGKPGNHQWKTRIRCNDCLPEYLRLQKNSRQQRYRDRHRVERSAICQHCGNTFTPQRSTARFCSTACRVATHRAANSKLT